MEWRDSAAVPLYLKFSGAPVLVPLTASFVKVGSNTALSRGLGFVRDLTLARLFGADDATDAFFVAFKIPNFLRRLFAEGAFAAAFVPVLTEYRTRRSPRELKALVDHVAGTLALVLIVVSLVAMAAAPGVIVLFAPGWALDGGPRLALAVDMLRLTFPYLLFISLTAFAGSILNAHNRFGVPAFTPVLLNLTLIASAFWLAPRLATPIMSLAWGVLIAGLAQVAFQLPFLYRLGLLPRFRPALRDPAVRRILRQMTPALLGVSMTQLNLLVDALLASFLASGSISWLYYSDRLVEFPVGILGVALGTVILPGLAERYAVAATDEFSRILDWGLRWVVLFGLPATVGLVVLSGPLISTLFQSAVFDAGDVRMSARSLVAYGLGVVPFLLIKVVAPGYYARQDTRTPVRFAVIALAVNLVMSLILAMPLRHAGLALATSLAAAVNAFLLLYGLGRAGIYRVPRGWPALLLKTSTAGGVMALLLWWGSGSAEQWIGMSASARVWRLGVWIGLGALVYFVCLWLCGVRRHDFAGRMPAARG